jgi:hypothetical protein
VLGSGIRMKPLYRAVLSVLNHEDCYGISVYGRVLCTVLGSTVVIKCSVRLSTGGH